MGIFPSLSVKTGSCAWWKPASDRTTVSIDNLNYTLGSATDDSKRQAFAWRTSKQKHIPAVMDSRQNSSRELWSERKTITMIKVLYGRNTFNSHLCMDLLHD